MRRFERGSTIVWRSIDRAKGQVESAWPWTVVRHDPASIVLYLPPGAVAKIRTGRYGGPRDRMLLEWDGGYSDRLWERTNVVMLHRFGDAHSFWLNRDTTTWQLGWWYVNLEEPWRQTTIGFDSRDHILDLWSGPDTEWHWKDEDELSWAIAQGWVPADRAETLRAEGQAAVARFRRRDAPLDHAWLDFRPDAHWPVPSLPEGWRDLVPTA